jgi:elongation factor Ts
MSYKISVADIKKFREATGLGMQDAQKILLEAGGDMAKATELARKKGLATAANKSSRKVKAGLIEAYVHGGGRVGVILEVNCETDFVAKTPAFKTFAHELALQVAATAPRYLSRADVPANVIEQEKSIYRAQLAEQKKSAEIMDRIIEGKLEKFYEETCLLEQPSIKDPKIKVSQLLTDIITKVGENVVISRFTRYQLGENQNM